MGLQRVGGSGDADSGMQTQTQRERERGVESGGRVPQYRCRISTETGLTTGISDFSEDVPLVRCEKTYESRLRESAVPLVSPLGLSFEFVCGMSSSVASGLKEGSLLNSRAVL